MRSILFPNGPSRLGGKTDLPGRITKAASHQTYYTIRLLVDRDRVQDAFRSYAYFRWVDDRLDSPSGSQQEKIEFINHQQALLEALYLEELQANLSPEEQMLGDLVGNDHEQNSGLQFYLRNMMNLMAFDAARRGRLISQRELSEYSHLLAIAVTEALFYFIGHQDPPPCSENRYNAVFGAHVVHMLRDAVEDIATGYINFPSEYIETEHISIEDMDSPSFRNWVYGRAKLAHRYFRIGIKYIAQVKNLRCRLAGFMYLARFEWMLNTIERDGYCLRCAYPERKSLRAGIWMVWRVFTSLLNVSWMKLNPIRQVDLSDQREER
jgi:phytoene/squalene synthetase